jgi:methylglutaconyl-CoA hydratase
MSYQFLIATREGAIEYLTLNRPDVRNAFNEEVIAELIDWAERVARECSQTAAPTMRRSADESPRAVVLAGAGKTFSAGADLTWMSRMIRYTEEENLRDAAAMSRMFTALDSLPVPLIGRVQGAALGGGCGLAAVCDVVVAEEAALFGFTEVKLGILPAVIAPFALAKIGRSAARELFLTGRRFTAARAREIGLVHEVVPAGGLDAAVDAYVREILTAGPDGIALAKSLIPKVWRAAGDDATALTTGAIARQRVSSEGQEGMRAFLEKRKPSWSA